jgi:hypothetical protein
VNRAVSASATGPRGAIGSAPPSTFPLEGRRPIPGHELAKQRRTRLLLTIAGLGGLMLLSFMIALAASNNSKQPAPRPPVKQDAGTTIAITPIPADAALLIAPPPLDASTSVIPTVPSDANAGDAYLEVRTIPDGGKVKVGDQEREAVVPDSGGPPIAQLILPGGKHEVTVELAGFAPETREVTLLAGEHQRVEIAFTKKLKTGGAMGKLTVRTTPWSDVYLGSQKLGRAPFVDIDIAAGAHTLTFKNPSRPTVTKTVTIKPGKSTKLNFNLP